MITSGKCAITKERSARVAILIHHPALLLPLYGARCTDQVLRGVETGPVMLQLSFDRHLDPAPTA
jgi:hypothetical protein